MVFRRLRADALAAHQRRLLDAPTPAPPLVLGPPEKPDAPQISTRTPDSYLDQSPDNATEDDSAPTPQALTLSPALRARAARLSGHKNPLAAE